MSATGWTVACAVVAVAAALADFFIVRRLRARRIAQLERENKTLHALNDARLRRFEHKLDGRMEWSIEDPTGMFQVIVGLIVDQYKQAGGSNYVEWSVVDHRTFERYTLLVQRERGKTPAERYTEARADVKRLLDLLAFLMTEADRRRTVFHGEANGRATAATSWITAASDKEWAEWKGAGQHNTDPDGHIVPDIVAYHSGAR